MQKGLSEKINFKHTLDVDKRRTQQEENKFNTLTLKCKKYLRSLVYRTNNKAPYKFIRRNNIDYIIIKSFE